MSSWDPGAPVYDIVDNPSCQRKNGTSLGDVIHTPEARAVTPSFRRPGLQQIDDSEIGQG